MPLFLIERQFAEELQLDASGVEAIKAVNADAGVDWLLLVSLGRPQEDLLPVRSAQRRSDPPGGADEPHPGRPA